MSIHRTDNSVADHLLSHCGGLQASESVVIVADSATQALAELFAARARRISQTVKLLLVPDMAIHGEEPPDSVAEAMARADLVLGLTQMSMAHTQARRIASERGARYLSMPDFDHKILQNPAVSINYRSVATRVREYCDALTAGREARITSAAGTDIRLRFEGRIANYCPGFVDGPGTLGSPPDIEANISPIETKSEGTIVVDGSIPCREIGLLDTPVLLQVSEGQIIAIEGSNTHVIDTLERMFDTVGSPKTRTLAECGIGLNPKAQLTGNMLTDEGAFGCIHFGFGSNATVGGTNDVPFHLDFVLRAPTLTVDGEILIETGTILL